MQNYRNLIAWKKGHALAIAGYRVARSLPAEERFEMGSQLRRALVSITSNIAEGSSRSSDRAFAAFLDSSAASAAEVENLLLLAADVGYIGREVHEPIDAQVREVRRVVARLRSVVKAAALENRRR
ncbi:MAG TPA: four helix bundle protein [Gemmatimonadaceae bacterium]|nr:four helix bundle protein [Gemmatimonadaceae bacterium]